MKQELLKQLEAKFIKKLPKFDIGDTIAVSTIIREGDKTRVQIFRGIIIAIKGAGISKTFTIRKISTAGVGVEKIIPFNSPNISKVVVIKKGTVRKSKLYYMRKRIGKRALKITEGVMDTEIAAEVIETPAEVTEKVAEDEQAAETAK
jgi:large subunit ribosomal protein L19